MDRRPKHDSKNNKTLRRKHESESSWSRIRLWLLDTKIQAATTTKISKLDFIKHKDLGLGKQYSRENKYEGPKVRCVLEE